MRVRMFQKRFAALVKSGAKCQTIRPDGKRMPLPGEFESWRMWSGKPYRSKQAELVTVQLTEVRRIIIDGNEILIRYQEKGFWHKILGLDAFAQADGFKGWPEMREWFREMHGLPFHGILIKGQQQAEPITDK